MSTDSKYSSVHINKVVRVLAVVVSLFFIFAFLVVSVITAPEQIHPADRDHLERQREQFNQESDQEIDLNWQHQHHEQNPKLTFIKSTAYYTPPVYQSPFVEVPARFDDYEWAVRDMLWNMACCDYTGAWYSGKMLLHMLMHGTVRIMEC